jgi:anti-sigma factor RsiW
MKCLTRVEMQAYIDKEMGGALDSLVNDHLRRCERCARLHDEVVADNKLVLDALDIVGKELMGDPVPSFEYPGGRKRRKIFPFIAAIVAAASVTGAVLIIKPLKNGNPTGDLIEAEMMMLEYYEGKDLNKMWQERSQPVVIKDEEGNVIWIE